MPIEGEITIEEYKELMRGNKKTRKRISGGPTGAERAAGEYLTITRSCQGGGKDGGSRLFYEPFSVRMGSVSYKPDWVVDRGPFDRECFEVKEVRRGPRGGMKWAGFRSREAQVKLELLKRVSDQFGWRVFLLLVEGQSIQEKEIL